MKVLLVNGSPRPRGCTYLALKEVGGAMEKEGIEYEIFQLGNGPIRDCIGCNLCQGKDRCAFDDDKANELIEKAKGADGFIFGSPVYYAHPSGRILSILDRAFYAGGVHFAHKPASSIVTARRAGTTASLDALNKYILDSEMPLVGSTYWNMVFGPSPDLVKKDEEGLQSMRNLARNMAWILKCLQAGKDTGIGLPATERAHWTNFNKADME